MVRSNKNQTTTSRHAHFNMAGKSLSTQPEAEKGAEVSLLGEELDQLMLSISQVDDTPLDEDELFDIQTALTPLTSKWKVIGSALRIKSGRLKEIEANNPNNAAECLLDVLTDWLNRNYNYVKFGEPTWRKVVEVVANEAAGANRALARSIAQEHRVSGPAHPLVSGLKSKLEFFNKYASSDDNEMEESKEKIIQGKIRHFIETSLQQGTSTEDIKEVLTQMYSSELLISKNVYKRALNEVSKSAAARPSVNYVEVEAESKPEPLFSEDTVYHASLCSLAVSTRDVSNYQKFFDSEYPQHCLEEVSLSRLREEENIYRYLIARQEKTYYVAFQSVPLLSEWEKKFPSFTEGISLQGERIPLRFFVRLIHDGYRIVFTGFSFGGLLGLHLTAAMWKLSVTLMSTAVLKENLACIAFGQPLLSLPLVKEVTEELPEFVSTVHSVFTWDDPVPRVTKFLDPRIDDLCAELVVSIESLVKKQLTSAMFQGSVTSSLLSQLKILQEAKDSAASGSGTYTSALRESKTLINAVLPTLLAKNGFKQHAIPGNAYVTQLESSAGLVWKKLQAAEVLVELTTPSSSHIDLLDTNLFQKHQMASYHPKVVKSYKKELPPTNTSVPLSRMQAVEPSVELVAFHRFGKEIAVTVKGNNLWFCYQIQVGPCKERVIGKDVSQKSIQFNFNPEDQQNLPSDSDHVKVTLSSHFCTPVRKSGVDVAHKVYTFTYRQEQLAKLTPSELIESAYMSALLEQHPHGELKCLSNRFDTLRRFLEQVVTVVPIESVIYAMGNCENPSVVAACGDSLVASGIDISPSLTLMSGMEKAVTRVVAASESEVQEPESVLEAAEEIETIIKEGSKNGLRKKFGKKGKKLHKGSESSPLRKIAQNESVRSSLAANGTEISLTCFAILTVSGRLPIRMQYLLHLLSKMRAPNALTLPAVCGEKLEHFFPLSSSGSGNTGPIKPPLQILREGKEKLSWLAKQNLDSDPSLSSDSESKKKLSELFNSKMLQIVNEIRSKELKICTLLLGAFMEEQVRIPLVKSSLDTAKALNLVVSAAAVGVWAIFSLALGDLQAIINSIPTRSLLVEVTEYIKGIFKDDTVIADQKYAGKLQFMVQSLDKTVSCNSHYVSYSLERQLVAMCRTLKIDEHTPLDTLIRDWDQIFKDNILSLVVPTHRSLIASWLKWALMVHNLREELAKYTAVGVVGLVNSGKSLLVSTLFDVKVPVGTTAVKRTTVPFLYNLNGCIDGLDVIDFPGVDDRDETIPDLAELLLSLAQLVVFVVDYRKAHTESAKKWLELLEDKSVPVLVSLTYADKLYAEHMGSDGSHPDPIHMKQELDKERLMLVEQLGQVPSHEVNFFSFCQDKDSVLNTPDGRQRLKDVGIGSPQDVGDWLAKIFETQMDQDDLAERVRKFVRRNDVK